MFKPRFCHTLLNSSFKNINKARIKTLLQCGDGLIRSNKMTLTAIGRHLDGSSQTKHKIKRIDRFISNDKVAKDAPEIYRQLKSFILPELPYYAIAVDWSGCCSQEYWLLRASLLVDGRSLVIYNQVVSKDELEQTHIHDDFLDTLSSFFKSDDKVYIVADGGFKTPWMKKVEALGWYHITRVRGRFCGKIGDGNWQPVSELSKGANTTPKFLGTGKLGKTSKTQCKVYFHVYKGKSKGRHNSGHRYPDAETTYKNMANEPWLISTNDKGLTANQVIKIYSRRMQIEQNFRDDKSLRYGFSWRHSKTASSIRISLLCLIATIATCVLWFIGFQSERRKLHYQFQANTVKNRRVLSFLSLAKNIIITFNRKRIINLFERGIKALPKEYETRLYELVS